MNIVANVDSKPEAVLIRGLEPIDGIEILKNNRKSSPRQKSEVSKIINLTNGPGKICEALKIDVSYNGLDCCFSVELFVMNPEDDDAELEIDRSTRININYAKEYIYKPWRFFIKNNPYVSKAKIQHEYKHN